MMHILFIIFSFITTIFIVVTVHEFGHFIVAKLFGIKVLRFSIGFGWGLWHRVTKSGTEFVIAALPLGGYVKLLDEREALVTPGDLPRAFNRRPIYQRLLVLVAGPLFNFIFAFFAFWIVYVSGIVFVKPVVGAILPGTPAAFANLQVGDEIVAIDEHPTPHWAEIAMALVYHYGEAEPLFIQVRHKEKNNIAEYRVRIDLKNWTLNALRPNPLASLGIVPLNPKNNNILHEERYSPIDALGAAWRKTSSFIAFNCVVLYKMLTGVISWKSLGGPLTIFEATVIAAGQGLIVFTNFLGLLSISIGIVNLFPIPGLDGAQIFYLCIEKIIGKPLSNRIQILLFQLGMVLLFLLIIQVILNDVSRAMKIAILF